jgi:hypothetical protein
MRITPHRSIWIRTKSIVKATRFRLNTTKSPETSISSANTVCSFYETTTFTGTRSRCICSGGEERRGGTINLNERCFSHEGSLWDEDCGSGQCFMWRIFTWSLAMAINLFSVLSSGSNNSLGMLISNTSRGVCTRTGVHHQYVLVYFEGLHSNVGLADDIGVLRLLFHTRA